MKRTILGFGLALTLVLLTTALVVPSVGAEVPPNEPNVTQTTPTLYLSADPIEIVADGSATTTITAMIWDVEDWIWSGPVVEFSTDLGEITASAHIQNGTATATLTAGTTSGTATITAEATPTGLGLLTNTTTVTFTSGEDGGDDNGGGSSSGGGGSTTTTPTPTVTTSPGVTPTATTTPTSTGTPGPTAGATTPGPAVTPGTTPGPTGTPATPTPKEPGFGAVVAIAGLLAVAYLLMGRRNE